MRLASLMPIGLLIYLSYITILHAEEYPISILQVSVKPLSELLLPSQHNATADVISLNQPTLRAQISASVIKIHVDIGDKVKEGEILLTLDCREYDYALQQAQAVYTAKNTQISLLKKNYQRDKKLIQQSSISQTRFDQSETNYLAARAEINSLQAQQSLAKLQVERCQIKAPFTGEITQRQVQIGQLVSHQTALFNLLQTDNLYISAQLTDADIIDIKQAKNIIFKHRPQGQAHTLQLARIVSFSDRKTRNQQVHFTIKDQHQALITGMAGRILWQSMQKKLPARYISKHKNQLGIFVLKVKGEQSKAVFIVLPEAEEGRDIPINLPLDTLVVDKGRLQLYDQQIVDVQ